MSIITDAMLEESRAVFDAHMASAIYKTPEQLANSVMSGFRKSFTSLSESGALDASMFKPAWAEFSEKMLPYALEKDYDMMSKAAALVQERINRSTGTSLKIIKPPINTDRINGIVKNSAAAGSFEDAAPALQEHITNFTENISDQTVRLNAESHWHAGLSPKIVRTCVGNCCEWCAALAGTYDYADVSDTGNDVFRRHENCRCTVEYKAGDGRSQNAHTKLWRADASVSKIQPRRYVEAPDDRQGIRTIA